MAKSFFKKLNSSERELVAIQDNVDRALTQLGTTAILDGALLENLDLVSGDNIVAHRLGRRIRGYVVVRSNAAITVYDKMDTDTALDRNFTVNVSADVKLSLWVF